MKVICRWHFRGLLLCVLFLSTTLCSYAANRYWVSILSANWNSALVWSTTSGGLPGASVPGSGDVAIFDGGGALGLDQGGCTINVPVSISAITVTSGYSGTITQGANTIAVSGAASFDGGTFAGGSAGISIGGAFTIAGTAFTSTSATMTLTGNAALISGSFAHNNGTVTFNGSSLQTITAPGGENFYNFIVANSNTGIQLENNISIASGLTMTSGNIDLNGNNLTLGISAVNPGTLSYSSGTMINLGSFTRWLGTGLITYPSSAGLFPTGTVTDYRPFYVSESVAPTTGGTITVSYTDATTNSAVSISDPPATIIVRKDLNWAVSTGGGLAGGTYSLDIQGTGYGTITNINDLRICLNASVVGVAGTNAGTTSDPQINRTNLSLANLTNTFYIGSVTVALPITLLSFTASVEGHKVELNWSTAQGTDNWPFTIERSKDAITWDSVEEDAAPITSQPVESYQAVDPAPYAGISFYRLRQTEPKQTNYSSVVPVDMVNDVTTCTLSPNPATDHILLSFPSAGNYKVVLLNSSGQLVQGPLTTSLSSLTLEVTGMKAGMYFVGVLHQGVWETKKVVLVR